MGRPTGWVLALCCWFAWAQIAFGQGPVGKPPRPEVINYLFCNATEQKTPGHLTIYFTSDFTTIGANTNPLRVAFFAFLQEKYSFKSTADPRTAQPVICTGLHSVEEAKSIEQTRINSARKDARYSVIETGWVPPDAIRPGTAIRSDVRPPAPPAAPSAPRPSPAATAQSPEDPRLAQMSPQERQFMLSEISQGKFLCSTNATLSGLMDCDCFAQAVLDYRIAHAGETATPSPLINVIAIGKLDCSKCLTDEKLTKWASEQMRIHNAALPAAQVKTFYDCVTRTFVTSFKGNRYVSDVRRVYNQAVVACNK